MRSRWWPRCWPLLFGEENAALAAACEGNEATAAACEGKRGGCCCLRGETRAAAAGCEKQGRLLLVGEVRRRNWLGIV